MTIRIPSKLIGSCPCLWCGEPVTVSSMDGPGVCVNCDMGYDKDGTKWPTSSYGSRNHRTGTYSDEFIKAMLEME